MEHFNIEDWHTAFHSDGSKCEHDNAYDCYWSRFNWKRTTTLEEITNAEDEHQLQRNTKEPKTRKLDEQRG